MASYIDKLKDTNGNIKYPVTLLKAIYNGDTNERLDNILADMDSKISGIVDSNQIEAILNNKFNSEIKPYVDEKISTEIGNLNTILDNINGEVV